MGLGDYFPGRVFNESSKSVLCIVSRKRKFEGKTIEEWVAYPLAAGYASPSGIDVDGVLEENPGDPALRRFGQTNAQDEFWRISGMSTEVLIEDMPGAGVRRLSVQSGVNNNVFIMKYSVLEDQGGVTYYSGWPSDKAAKKI